MDDAQRLALGLLPVVVGGQEVEVPKLKFRAGLQWRKAAMATYSELAGVEFDPAHLEQSADLIDKLDDMLLGLIIDYDATDVLGGRDGLEDAIYPNEIAPIFQAMLNATLPFDLAGQQKGGPGPLAASSFPSSLNGRSHTGGSTPTPSVRASTRGS